MWLTGKTVIITRPAHQAGHLASLIEAVGGQVIVFPTLTILPIQDPNRLLTAVSRLSQYQIAIFVSANAVSHALALLGSAFPAVCVVIAIGPGTARALEQYSVGVTAMPDAHHSEGLLALPLLENIKGKKIAIFCGENTRPTLRNALIERGANVDEVICYRRCCPDVDAVQALKQWGTQQPAAIISTSQESLANLWQLFAKVDPGWLLRTPLLVISPAMVEQAKKIGFQVIIHSAGASDQAIFAALQGYA